MNTVITLGRFQGLHLGHDKIIRTVIDLAKTNNCKPIIFIIDGILSGKDKIKNPLSGEQRLKIMRQIYPDAQFEVINNINDIEDVLYIMGYELTCVVAGSDRIERYKTFFKDVNFVSIYRNDTLENGVESISGTKVRELIKNNNFDDFYKVFPSKKLAKEVFNMIKEINDRHIWSETSINIW